MAWSPRGNLKGPMGDNLISSPTLVTDFNDAVNTNGKSQSFSVAGAMSNGPPEALQAYIPVLYLQGHASYTGGPVARFGMQVVFGSWSSGAAIPQTMWIRTVSTSSFGAWLRIVDEVLLTAALDVINGTLATLTSEVTDALALKADDSSVVHNTGDENIAGVKTFLDSIRQYTDGNTFVFLGDAPAIQWRSNNENNRIRARASITDTSNTGWQVHKWEGGSWERLFSFNFTGDMSPAGDNVASCGTASTRWSVVYAGTGAINTSDARDKTAIAPLTDAEITYAKQLAGEIGTFQWLSMIEQKGGENARHHVGITVQRCIELAQANGLDPFRYAFICYDEWDETPEIVDEWPEERDEGGNVIREAGSEVVQEYRPAGDLYSLRHDELLLFMVRGVAARLDVLEGNT